MVKIKAALVYLVLLICFSRQSAFCENLVNGNQMIDVRKAIQIADSEAKRRGYKPDEMQLAIENEKDIDIQNFEADSNLKNAIQGKKFWIIHYLRKGHHFGGILLVFVSKDDGSILGAAVGE